MKITELKCTACHGTLKADKDNPKIAVCEYCQTKHILEYESSGEVHFGTPLQRTPSYIEITENRPSAGRYVVPILMLVLVSCFTIGSALLRSGTKSATTQKTPTGGALVIEEEKEEKKELTGILANMAEEAIGKPVDSLTEEDLARFLWIRAENTSEVIKLGYSFDHPYESEEAALIWLEYPRNDSKLDIGALPLFSELKLLEIPNSLKGHELPGLKLQGISCYLDSPADLNEALDYVDELKEVTIQGTLKSLEGIEQLKGVESLSVSGSNLTDLSGLVALKQLKSLAIINCNNVDDFSFLHVMTWLEELSIKSKEMKDISFVQKMPELQSFSLSSAQILNLDSLADNQSLLSLSIEDCNDLINCDAVSTLTGLRQLSLKIPIKCAQPNLSTLNQLESLSIYGMDSITFLESMPNLAELELRRCKINQTSSFAALTNLKRLTCKSLSSYDVEWGFAAKIPSLEILDLTGTATYKDISMLFNIPTIKELYLSGMECELNFSALQPNASLEVLHLDGVKLYKNVKISGSGGITYIDYDRVTLDEHTAFLANYPNLKEVSLAENKLAHIAFAEQLLYLESINIDDNYVTDLKPLEALPVLRKVECKGNPVENYRVLNDEVLVIK